ncbi:hypothetical protein H9Y04_21475 [Streptomyces sp. TRM66268-LWL]|uniref:Lipoprotein n=1 Tax=Streptomyces polyasparticus TaxID=2767826 RepID=A0ABR7SHY1_9ACTN|nr:hypothetical protein [Streptomyces polyasparticus]MBC9715125.1 hypothetical protein [Streptomyces polyasparticus]
MRPRRRTAAAILAGGSVLALCATPAAAADDWGNWGWQVSVSPTTVKPGGTVTLTSSGCQEPSVKADAAIFDTVDLNEGKSATAWVFDDAKPAAEYEVTFTCKTQTKKVTLKIADDGGTIWPKPTHHGTQPPIHKGVKAGSGGTFDQSDLIQLGLGGALVAGALGASLYWARRRGDGRV